MPARLEVRGMTCMGCVGRVRDALAAVDGVEAAEVTLDPPHATVTGSATSDALIAAVAAVGKEASLLAPQPPKPERLVLEVRGMTCMGCVGRVRDALAGVDGVEAAEVTLDPPHATITGRAAVDELVAAVASVGKEATPLAEPAMGVVAGAADTSTTAPSALASEATAASPAAAAPVLPVATAPAEAGAHSSSHQPVRALPVAAKEPGVSMQLSVRGMTCSSCTSIVEKVLLAVPGVQSAKVNLLAARASVVVDDPQATRAAVLADAVGAAGYTCEVVDDGVAAAAGGRRAKAASVLCADLKRARKAWDVLRELKGVEAAVVMPSAVEIVVDGEAQVTDVLKALEGGEARREIGAVEIVMDEEVGAGTAAGGARKESEEDESKMWLRRCRMALAFTVPLMLLNFAGPARLSLSETVFHWLLFALATPVQFVCGRGFYRASYYALRKGRATMDVLIALSTSIAYCTSVVVVILGTFSNAHDHAHLKMSGGSPRQLILENGRGIGKAPMFNVSAMIITLVLIGKLLESLAKRRAAAGVRSLSALAPKDAVVFDHAAGVAFRTRVPVALLQVGDHVRVAPGESVPVDAIVVEGRSAINESMLTGESVPVPKVPGDFVYGGTTNGSSLRSEYHPTSGGLLLRTTAVEEDAVLAQIVRLVDDAQTSRAPIEAYADRVSALFVPSVVALSLIVFVCWYTLAVTASIPAAWFAKDGAFTFALLFALETMVIACPCALGLATPTAVMVASEVSAKLGILFRGGGAALEAAQGVKTVIFDKTGTLTMGKPTVAAVVVGTQAHSTEAASASSLVSSLVAVVEAESRHPLASAILDYISEKGQPSRKVAPFPNYSGGALASKYRISEVEELPGRGMRAVINDGEYRVRIGSRAWALGGMERKLLTDGELETVQQLEQEGGLTVVAAVVNDTFVNMYGLEDMVRPEAADVISYLENNLGVSCRLVTGDSEKTALAVAEKVGIHPANVVSGALPWQKVDVVKELPAGTSCFVGDGVNDAPALATASVGIAIGAGAPIAAENASVVLVRSDLAGVVHTVDLARTSFSRVRLNFIWAMGYNILGIPLAAGLLFPFTHVRVPPAVASASMALSSTCVIASSMALRLYKPPSLAKTGRLVKPECHRAASGSWDTVDDHDGQTLARPQERKRGHHGPVYVLVDEQGSAESIGIGQDTNLVSWPTPMLSADPGLNPRPTSALDLV